MQTSRFYGIIIKVLKIYLDIATRQPTFCSFSLPNI